jgi:hypothetical protein
MPKTRNFEFELERIRKEGSALLALMIAPDRAWIAADPNLAPKDIVQTLRGELPALHEYMTQRRAKR